LAGEGARRADEGKRVRPIKFICLGKSMPGANTPSRLCRTPPAPKGRGRKCCRLSPSASSPGAYPKGEGVFQRVGSPEKKSVPFIFPFIWPQEAEGEKGRVYFISFSFGKFSYLSRAICGVECLAGTQKN
jgi:hypothetical protein